VSRCLHLFWNFLRARCSGRPPREHNIVTLFFLYENVISRGPPKAGLGFIFETCVFHQSPTWSGPLPETHKNVGRWQGRQPLWGG